MHTQANEEIKTKKMRNIEIEKSINRKREREREADRCVSKVRDTHPIRQYR